jgi:serine protease Do
MFLLKTGPRLFALLLGTAAMLGGGTAAAAPPGEIPDSVRAAVDEAVARVKPALVRIHVVQYYYGGGREVKYEASGSGAIITPEGHVVTNHHVAGNTKHLLCTLSDKREVEADLVGTDPLSDIAVIKLRAAEGEKFPFAAFGDSSRLRVGDRVLAMGSPMALSQSVTLGIVSNTEMVMPRRMGFFKFTLEGEDVGSLVLWVGHDAPIYGGNSGGPLVNLAGEIVGVNEIRVGLGGAIPGNLARAVAEEIIERGKVRRSWLGLDVQPLLKSHKDQDVKTGVLVSGTFKGSPAEKAEFLPGDILKKLAGREVSVRFEEEIPRFNQLRMGLAVGEEVEAVVLRDGKEKTLRVTPVERENVRAEGAELREWGVTARSLSLVASKELKRKTRDGVLVTSVRPGGPSGESKPALRPRDVIVEVEGVPVKNLDELAALTERVLAPEEEENSPERAENGGRGEPVPVTVAFERKSRRLMTVVKVGLKELQDPGLEVRKAWLGVAFQVLTKDLAKALDLDGRKGVRATQVYPGSPAEAAGLEVGDVIVALDGEEIPASYPEDTEVFSAMIRQYKIGSRAALAVIREGVERTIEAEFGSSPKLARELPKYRDDVFDFTARDVAFLDRAREKWPAEQRGALVEVVGEGGWAALGRLAVDDLLIAVNGVPVEDAASLEVRMRAVAREKPKSVVLRVLRGIHTLYLELEPAWSKAAP